MLFVAKHKFYRADKKVRPSFKLRLLQTLIRNKAVTFYGFDNSRIENSLAKTRDECDSKKPLSFSAS